jgi:hypothetical protein
MIWYSTIDAINAIRLGVQEDYQRSRRGLRLVIGNDHGTGS